MFNLFKKKQVLAAVTKLNETLEAAMAEETPAEEAPTGKKYTEDEIKISAMEIGGKVELVDGDGQLQPAPDGEYELESGDKFTVVDGQITELNGEKAEDKSEETPVEETVQADEETPVEEPKADDKQEQIDALVARLDAFEARFAELEAAITGAASKEDVQGLNSEFTKMNENLKFLASVPAEASKTTTSTVTKESNKQKVDNLKAVFGVK